MVGDTTELQAVCERLVVGQRLGGRAPVHICKWKTFKVDPVGKQDTGFHTFLQWNFCTHLCACVLSHKRPFPCLGPRTHACTHTVHASTRPPHGTSQHLWPQHVGDLEGWWPSDRRSREYRLRAKPLPSFLRQSAPGRAQYVCKRGHLTRKALEKQSRLFLHHRNTTNVVTDFLFFLKKSVALNDLWVVLYPQPSKTRSRITMEMYYVTLRHDSQF